jgi:hypothetical protein
VHERDLLRLCVCDEHTVAGRFDDFSKVASALEGAYGAWINTDGFTVGEERELFAGMRIFELAKQTKGLKHYVWSNLDYTFKAWMPISQDIFTAG